MRDWSLLEGFVHKTMIDHLIPGVAVAVWQNGKTVYARGFGHRDRSTLLPVDPDTVFGVASVTKSFTTMSVMQLVDRGLLCLDDPVTKYVPEFTPRGEAMEAITVRHLLSHTGGLPPLPSVSYTANPGDYPSPHLTEDGRISPASFRVYMKHILNGGYEMLGKPDEFFSYSNPGFVIASVIIERLTGKRFYRYVQENVFDPIGMGRSTFVTGDLSKMKNVTRLYQNTRQGETVNVTEWPDSNVFGASGGVKSTANDLVKYAGVYASMGMKGQVRVLSEGAVRRMMTPVYRINRASHYGLAVQITPDYSGYTLVEHGGSLPGVSSTFGFVPEANLAVVTLANVQFAPAADIWLAAVNTALGLSVERKRFVEPHWDTPKGYFEQYAGHYVALEGADLWVKVGPEGPVLCMGDEQFLLRATGEGYAVFDYHGQQRFTRFFHRPDGSVVGLFNGNSMTGIRLVPKVQ